MKHIAAWLGLSFILTMPASHAQTAPARPFIVGIGRSIHDATGVTAALSWLGVRSVRLDIPWKEVEKTPGVYKMPDWVERAVDEANAQGIATLAILAYGHPSYGSDKPRSPAAIAAYSRYAHFVVEHFKDRIRLYDVWNEWETHTGHTTPGAAMDYVTLLRSTYPAIKEANSQAIVLSGGFLGASLDSGWFESFLRAGGLQYVDALSVHPYNYQQSGVDLPERAVAQLERMHALAQTYARGRAIDIYITEMGFPIYQGKGGVSDARAVDFLNRFYRAAAAQDFIAGVWWYCLRDQGRDPTDKEQNFGVMDFSMVPKSVAYALRGVSAALTQSRPQPPSALQATPD